MEILELGVGLGYNLRKMLGTYEKTQSLVVPLIFSMSTEGREDVLLKTLSFRSFKIFQAMRGWRRCGAHLGV
jgi:hypothetical protein